MIHSDIYLIPLRTIVNDDFAIVWVNYSDIYFFPLRTIVYGDFTTIQSRCGFSVKHGMLYSIKGYGL